LLFSEGCFKKQLILQYAPDQQFLNRGCDPWGARALMCPTTWTVWSWNSPRNTFVEEIHFTAYL